MADTPDPTINPAPPPPVDANVIVDDNTDGERSGASASRSRYDLRNRTKSSASRASSTDGSMTSATSMGTDSSMGQYDSDVNPLSRIVGPLSAAARVALDSKKYPKRTKRKIRKAVKYAGRNATLEKTIEDTSRLVTRYTDKYDKITEDEPVDKSLKYADPASKDTFQDIKKSLKREYNTKFAHKSDALNSFLEDFVAETNFYKLNHEQSEKLLTSFFGGQLRNIVRTLCKQFGLQHAIDAVRRYKGTQSGIEDFRRKIQNFKMPKGNVAESLFDLHSYYVLGHPQSPACATMVAFKDRVMSLLSPAGQERVAEEESKSRQAHFGEEMDLDSFIKLVDRIVTAGTTSRNVNTVDTSQFLTKDDIPSLVREIANLTTQNQASGQDTGAIPKRKHTYIHDHNAMVTQAMDSCKKHHLQNRHFPVMPTQQYSMDAKGQVWPQPKVFPKPFARNLAVFQKDNNTGRFSYTSAIRNHLKDVCITCGLPGHTSESHNCPYKDQPNSNQLCNTCRAGFHATCRYPHALIGNPN